MAGTATLKAYVDTKAGRAIEVFKAVLGGADTTVVVTPSKIKAIEFVDVVPMDAASCAAGIPYLTSFAVGNGTVTVTGANSTTFLVKLEGRI